MGRVWALGMTSVMRNAHDIPRTAGGLSHFRTAGGYPSPQRTKKTKKDSDKRYAALDRPRQEFTGFADQFLNKRDELC